MNSEFSSFNDMLRWAQADIKSWDDSQRNKSARSEDYKKVLKEKTQFFYTISDMTNIIADSNAQKQHAFWAISEIITEAFSMNPPLMSRYKPEIIEWAYRLRPDRTIEYTYGRRFAEFNQIFNVIQTLSERSDSKRAVLNIFTAYDTDPKRSDVPCHLMLTYKIRNGKINSTAFFRSHDFFSGVKYDLVFDSFMAQLIAMGVNANTKQNVVPGVLGLYEDSLHVYVNKDKEKLQAFEKENIFNADERFNVMFPYKSVKEMYDDLWYVVKVEEAAYYGNFEFALEKLNKILNPAFKDFARVYYNKNLKNYKSTNKLLKFETKVLRW